MYSVFKKTLNTPYKLIANLHETKAPLQIYVTVSFERTVKVLSVYRHPHITFMKVLEQT
jgi:hypothetical protein